MQVLICEICEQLKNAIGESDQKVLINGEGQRWKFGIDNECLKAYSRCILEQHGQEPMWVEYQKLLGTKLGLTSVHIPKFIEMVTEIARAKSCEDIVPSGIKQEKKVPKE